MSIVVVGTGKNIKKREIKKKGKKETMEKGGWEIGKNNNLGK